MNSDKSKKSPGKAVKELFALPELGSKFLIIGGGILLLIGTVTGVENREQLAFSWLLSYMFFLSICMGSLFLIIITHLFDAAWAVPFRRINESIISLFPIMGLLFIPIALLALFFDTPHFYEWMQMGDSPDPALHAKQGWLNKPFFILRACVYFAVWSWLGLGFRKWSIRQDKDGSPECTHKMRKLAYAGIYIFAFTLTAAVIDWVKALEHSWYSTMYGVVYFAGSVWVTLAATYLIALFLDRSGPLKPVMGNRQYHGIAILMLAFTVFYAYVHFSQYFLIWNANIPEETFWYVKREIGSWWDIGILIVFGHFFFPFLMLLRIDIKLALPIMVPLCAWNMLMHYIDLTFNIMPVLHDSGYVLHWLDIASFAVIGGILAYYFMKRFSEAAPFPIKDPRLGEAVAETLHEREHQAQTAAAATDGGAE
ncbi:MAG TPA: hypothetical protein EYQ50_19075 [Verrucomicrobiales bacterium]|nr:hypothetical protein [Verrucomicrobiales bacterium]